MVTAEPSAASSPDIVGGLGRAAGESARRRRPARRHRAQVSPAFADPDGDHPHAAAPGRGRSVEA